MNTDATIFVVDDDASMRKSLLWLLRSAGWRAEAFASAEDFLARPLWSGPGCLILDVRMPQLTGPQLRDRLAAASSPLPIIFLTGHGDVSTGVDAMKKGAVDFLLKPVDDQVLLQTIQLAVERHRAARARASERDTIRERLARLSGREMEVMEYVIGGCLNKQIADALGIAEKTIKIHRGRVMQKMEANSLAELIHLCQTAGVPPPPPRHAAQVSKPAVSPTSKSAGRSPVPRVRKPATQQTWKFALRGLLRRRAPRATPTPVLRSGA